MFERLSRDTISYGIAMLLIRGLQIFLLPIYTRVLGAQDYGFLELITIAGALVNLTVALEISQGMGRYVADASDEGVRRAYATTAFGFSLLAYCLFALIVWTFALELSEILFFHQADSYILTLAAWAIAVNGVFVIAQDLLRWHLRPGAYLMASIAYALGSAGIGIWFVSVLGMGVAGVFWGQLAGAFMGLIFSLSGSAGLLGWLFDVRRLRTMLSYSLPLVISGVAVFGSSFIDRIVVRDVLGLEALGVYGVTARFASVVSILAIGFQFALSPLVFRHWQEPEAASILGKVFRLYLVAMVALVGALSLLSEIIITTMTGPAFHAGNTVLPLLALGAMFSTLYVFAPGLFLSGQTGKVALLNVLGAIINLCASLILIPWLGFFGAALAATITPACVFIGYLIFGHRWFRVQYQGVRVAFSLFLAMGLVLVGVFWPISSTPWEPIILILKLILWIFCVSLAFLVGTDVEDRRSALQFVGALALKRFI